MSRKVKIKQDVRHGCILTPMLFNMYSAGVINTSLEREKSIVINGKSFTSIGYGYDTVILAENEYVSQTMLDNIVKSVRPLEWN